MRLIEFLEHNKTHYVINMNDMIFLLKEVDLDKYTLLSTACAEWISPLENDHIFCDVEWNFMQYWFHKKGFTENDFKYIESCGYERDQFVKEAI